MQTAQTHLVLGIRNYIKEEILEVRCTSHYFSHFWQNYPKFKLMLDGIEKEQSVNIAIEKAQVMKNELLWYFFPERNTTKEKRQEVPILNNNSFKWPMIIGDHCDDRPDRYFFHSVQGKVRDAEKIYSKQLFWETDQ